jgi:hypothetical protein
MRGLLELDRVLRGDATAPRELAQHNGLQIAFRPLVLVNLALAAVYGVCMGFFGVFNRDEPEFRQMLADMFKVPALFVLTLLVTFPSLYVFNALIGSRLSPASLGKLLAAALAVLLAVLSAFGPIVAFFSVTTTSYPFIVLLNVAMFTVAGGFGLSFLLQTLAKLARLARQPATPVEPLPVEDAEPGNPASPLVPVAAETASHDLNVKIVFRIWLVVFALVGAQMSWVLRPFVGSPEREFAWFRPREASFFQSVTRSLRSLLEPETHERRSDDR